MYVGIRDEILLGTGFDSIHEGLSYYDLKSVEMHVDRDNTVHALIPTPDKPRLSLASDDGVDTLQQQARSSGVRVSAFLLGNDFNAQDREKELSWITRVVEASARMGVPAVRIDAIMSGEKDLPLAQR